MDERRRHALLPSEELQHKATETHVVRDSDMGTGMGTANASLLSYRLASELFALLLELPVHRRELQSASRDGDPQRLARAAHKLLGAVVYCDLPELADALRELKRMVEFRNTAQAEPALNKVFQLIDELLACSGYRET
jgi:HPt (histidine-containing phosphotransfer) domain-containing protein